MVVVEIKAVPEGAREHEVVARLTVNDDGSYEAWDRGRWIPWDLPALRPREKAGNGPEGVPFRSEPMEWARRLGTIYRTGYIVPVIVHDDAAHSTGEH